MSLRWQNCSAESRLERDKHRRTAGCAVTTLVEVAAFVQAVIPTLRTSASTRRPLRYLRVSAVHGGRGVIVFSEQLERWTQIQAASPKIQISSKGTRLESPCSPTICPRFVVPSRIERWPVRKAGHNNSCTGDFRSVAGVASVDTDSRAKAAPYTARIPRTAREIVPDQCHSLPNARHRKGNAGERWRRPIE